MINNKKILHFFSGITILVALSLFTCDKVPGPYCGDGEPIYDPLFQFCYGETTIALCGGRGGAQYNPSTHGCENDVIVSICENGTVPLGTPCNGYALTVSTTPPIGGTIYVDGMPSMGKSSFDVEATVAIYAEPNPGYTFQRWLGETNNDDNPTLITMDANKTIAAVFTQVGTGDDSKRTLFASAQPAIGGTVLVNNVQADDVTSHAIGATVTMSASAASGYSFAGWSGDTTSAQPQITVTMNKDWVLFATFTPIKHTLTVNANQASVGSVFVNGSATEAGTNTSHDFGEAVSVRARPNAGYVFTGWSGESTSTDTSITLDIVGNVTLTANFQLKQTYRLTVTASPTAGGTVTPTLVENIDAGTPVTVTADPKEGYTFQRWTVTGNAAIANANSMSTTVTIGTANATVTATFAQIQVIPTTYTLTVNRSPEAGGTTVPELSQSGIEAGKPFNISASASNGYKFVNWTLTSTPSTAGFFDANATNTTITMLSNATITANFQRVYTFTIDADPTGGGTVWSSLPLATDQPNITAGTQINIAATPASGYKFTGWLGMSSGGNSTTECSLCATTSVTVNSNTRMTARFQRVYTVSFNTNGGTPGTISAATVDSGGTLGGQMPVVTRGGYAFGGWFEGEVQYTSSTSISIDVTLAARWMIYDSRDGKTYKAVKIGNQTWMAENLNYPITTGSWCYDNDPANCEIYGRLYTWDAAMEACPDGWHLPTRAEWATLVSFVGSSAGKKLKSTSGWGSLASFNGTDEYGFSALPGGNRNSGGSFSGVGSGGGWWSATEGGNGAYYRFMYRDIDNVMELSDSRSGGFSVRCVAAAQ